MLSVSAIDCAFRVLEVTCLTHFWTFKKVIVRKGVTLCVLLQVL